MSVPVFFGVCIHFVVIFLLSYSPKFFQESSIKAKFGTKNVLGVGVKVIWSSWHLGGN